jgi:hypothetical protein
VVRTLGCPAKRPKADGPGAVGSAPRQCSELRGRDGTRQTRRRRREQRRHQRTEIRDVVAKPGVDEFRRISSRSHRGRRHPSGVRARSSRSRRPRRSTCTTTRSLEYISPSHCRGSPPREVSARQRGTAPAATLPPQRLNLTPQTVKLLTLTIERPPRALARIPLGLLDPVRSVRSKISRSSTICAGFCSRCELARSPPDETHRTRRSGPRHSSPLGHRRSTDAPRCP